MQRLVLAITAEHADALLDGTRDADHRTMPPAKLPAKAYLAVVGTGAVVGECVLAERGAKTKDGWRLSVTNAKRYRRPRPIADYGLAKVPRSFRYL